ncbi:hypothetical protein GCM10027398_19210 [Azotobacter salinestris]|nr:M10 family metallopeptidase C-terminal domain-containing protein [Azotobacter salinestris]
MQPDGKILMAGSSYNTKNDNYDFSIIRLNADGTLDTSFSGDGKASFDIEANSDDARSLNMQPDSKILVAVSSSNYSLGNEEFSVIRLNADGTLDTSFSGDGKAPIDFGSGGSESLTVQPDGRILVSGSSYDANSHHYDFSVIRLNADGTLDTSFNGDGKASFDIGGDDDIAHSQTLQSDGKILVAGVSRNTSTHNNEFSVIRLNADGTLDTSFSGDGKASFAIGGYVESRSLAVQPDGKILMAGSSRKGSIISDTTSDDFTVIRLNADGTLDNNFSGDGKASFDIRWNSDKAQSLTVQPDGRILVSGSSYNANSHGYDFSVIRLNADGTLDRSFGALDDDMAILEGTDASDTLSGSNAPELILGKGGDDSLRGEGGDDILDGGAGRDMLRGGLGADVFRFSLREDSHRTSSEGFIDWIIDFNPSQDRIDLSALGFTGLGDGHDGTLAVQENSAGTLTYLKSFEADAEGRRFEITLPGNFAGLLDSGNLIFEPVALEGTEDNDNLQGSPVAEILVGQGGDDRLHGAGGNDLLDGGAGRDRLAGSSGADVFRFSSHDHSYRTDSKSFADRIFDFDPDQDRIDLSPLGFTGLGDGHDGTLAVRVNDAGTRTYLKSFEVDAEGRRFEIVLDGDLSDRLDGGNVLFAPLAIEDTGAGDSLIGSSVAEILVGHGGDDRLHGAGGDDLLDGGLGRDSLIGGTGADLFRFTALEDSYRTDSEGFSDLILDFDAGEDRIDLSALGFTDLGDGHGGTLAVWVNEAGTHTYLKSFEADAEGRRFEIALEGDYGEQLSADVFLFAAPAVTSGPLEVIGRTPTELIG